MILVIQNDLAAAVGPCEWFYLAENGDLVFKAGLEFNDRAEAVHNMPCGAFIEIYDHGQRVFYAKREAQNADPAPDQQTNAADDANG